MLAGTRWRPQTLLIADDADWTRDLRATDLAIECVPSDRLAELCGSREHQGAAAQMPPYPYLDLDQLLAQSPRRLVVLDRTQYANNFGNILRTAETFGFDGCLVTDRGQCEITAAIARLSAGAIFHLPVAVADDLAAAVGCLHASGMRCVASDLTAAATVTKASFSPPVAIVVGAEHDGVRPEVAAACDQAVLIPQVGRTQSLNAASAAAVLMYEAVRADDSQTIAFD